MNNLALYYHIMYIGCLLLGAFTHSIELILSTIGVLLWFKFYGEELVKAQMQSKG